MKFGMWFVCGFSAKQMSTFFKKKKNNESTEKFEQCTNFDTILYKIKWMIPINRVKWKLDDKYTFRRNSLWMCAINTIIFLFFSYYKYKIYFFVFFRNCLRSCVIFVWSENIQNDENFLKNFWTDQIQIIKS